MFLESTRNAHSVEDLCTAYSDSLSDMGYDRIIFGLLTDHKTIDKAANTLVYNSYPEAWREYYDENNFRTIDPVRCATVNKGASFLWQDLEHEEALSKKQIQCLNECRDADLHNGIGIPLHGPFGEMAAIGVASSQKDSDPEHCKDIINLYSYHFYNSYKKFVEEQTQLDREIPHLTDREKEVLTWCAAGKSNWSISKILDISTHGVDFHIRNAMKKLDAQSRTVAVVKALHKGLISPV